jgi:hypothetical protein
MRPTLGTDIAAPAELAWQELIQLSNWPEWGPTVRGARLDDGGGSVFPGATGSVQTSVGLWLPFRVSGWEESGSRRTWSWRVGGVPATTHTVIELGASRCRVEMSVPLLAPVYLGVVALALRRIKRRVETAPRPA